MASVYRTDQAEEDLFDIWYFIAVIKKSKTAAERFIRKLDIKMKFLAENPNVGTPRDHLSQGLRMWPVGNYEIFYLISDSGIIVVRVLERHRDINNLF